MIPMRIQLICATIMVIVHYRNDKNAAFGMLTNSVNRCDAAPCNCDAYARLICDCNHDPEVGLTIKYRKLYGRRERERKMIENQKFAILFPSSVTKFPFPYILTRFFLYLFLHFGVGGKKKNWKNERKEELREGGNKKCASWEKDGERRREKKFSFPTPA